MGADAEAAIGEFFSSNKWYKDPQPSPSSGLQPKRIERPEAEWDETKWRKSNFRENVGIGILFIPVRCSSRRAAGKAKSQ